MCLGFINDIKLVSLIFPYGVTLIFSSNTNVLNPFIAFKQYIGCL